MVKLDGGGCLQIAGTPITESKLDTKKIKKTVIARYSLFYGTPNRVPNGGSFIGLPFRHVLNKTKLKNIDLLVERIFYRGAIVTTSARKSKTWGTLRAFCSKLLKQHKKCSYRMLLEYYCPDMGTSIMSGVRLSGEPMEIVEKENPNSGIWECVQPQYKIFSFVKAVIGRLLGVKHADRSLEIVMVLFKSIGSAVYF
jgi:hypothetical protein